MARTTSTQRGASRGTTRTASSGTKSRGASPSRSRTAPSRSRGRVSASRARRPAGPIVPIAIVGVIAVLAWSLYPAMRLQYMAGRSLATVQQQYAALAQSKDALQAQVTSLQTTQGVEANARKDLGYAKKGESVYIVVPAGEASGTAGTGSGPATASVAGVPAPSLFQQVLDFIFGVPQPSTVVEP